MTRAFTVGLLWLALACGPAQADDCGPKAVRRWREIIDVAAELYALPQALLWAVTLTESHGNSSAVSHAGAAGLSQLMPRTARSQGVFNRLNPYQSILGGARYLRLQINRFGGNLVLALAAYNAGPGAVVKYGGVPPFKETRRYVPKVLRRYREYTACLAQKGTT